MRTCLLLVLGLSISVASADNGRPKTATWATKPVGPDGPWNAVRVSIGGDSQPLMLFPGRLWQTIVPTSSYCSKNASTGHCTSGTYLKDKAVADQLNGIQFKTDVQDVMAGVQMKGKNLDTYSDTCDVVGEAVPNCSLALVDDQMMAYPGGQWFPLFAGCLSLGAGADNQSYGLPGRDLINATIFPWYLYRNGAVPSSSFGMHIGSASAASPMQGSLSFGGFDRNRLTGDVLTLAGEPSTPVLLTDISIKVVRGPSPFDLSDKKANLLLKGNSSMPKTGIPVTLDGCSPYLTLPRTTCDGISAHLPVTYNGSLGLYLWNTKDPRYKDIVNSASVLSFSFMGSDNTKSVAVHVPFQHLNLTLEPPLVDEPVPYFPCSTGGTGSYVLGRAFLQDAFLAGNWHKETWWLGQAPGPNIPANADVVSMQPDDVSIRGSGNDWVASWDPIWSSLAASNSGPSVPQGQGAESKSDLGLSTGGKAGISIGATAAVLVILGALLIWWCKRKHGKQATQEPCQETYFREKEGMPGASMYEPKCVPYTPQIHETSGKPVQITQPVYELS